VIIESKSKIFFSMAMANTDNTTLITNLCTTKFAILKWLQMLCYIIIVFFLIDGHRQWGIYTFVCILIRAGIFFCTFFSKF